MRAVAQNRTRSHSFAQQFCLTVLCGSIIGEMFLSSCARSPKPAGRLFVSLVIYAAGFSIG